MEDNNDIRSKGKPGASSLAAIVLAIAIALAPIARAENFYLARAIGEPSTTTPAPASSAGELPGLGTEPKSTPADATQESGSTWKWVVGVALAAAVVALANKGGDKGGGGSTATSGGGTGGGSDGGGSSGGGGGDSDGGGGGGVKLPKLPGNDD